jgi:hypothetical protein
MVTYVGKSVVKMVSMDNGVIHMICFE